MFAKDESSVGTESNEIPAFFYGRGLGGDDVWNRVSSLGCCDRSFPKPSIGPGEIFFRAVVLFGF